VAVSPARWSCRNDLVTPTRDANPWPALLAGVWWAREHRWVLAPRVGWPPLLLRVYLGRLPGFVRITPQRSRPLNLNSKLLLARFWRAVAW